MFKRELLSLVLNRSAVLCLHGSISVIALFVVVVVVVAVSVFTGLALAFFSFHLRGSISPFTQMLHGEHISVACCVTHQ